MYLTSTYQGHLHLKFYVLQQKISIGHFCLFQKEMSEMKLKTTTLEFVTLSSRLRLCRKVHDVEKSGAFEGTTHYLFL